MPLRLALGVTFGCVLSALPDVAAACGATPTPYVTLTEALPTKRAGIPRDGAVVIRAKLWGPSGGPFSFANARLLDAAGATIPTTSVMWFSATPAMALAPAEPLAPGTRVTIEASVPSSDAVKPAAADGPTAVTWNYDVGDGLAEPLALAGGLRVTVEPFDADVIDCSHANNCGTGCVRVGTRRALRARVVIPAVTGGVDFDGYRGWLHFTDNQPATFAGAGEGRGSGNINLPNWLDLRPGAETEVLQELVEEDQAYAPCFALNVWDPAGHAIQAPPVCEPSVKPSERLRALDAANGGGCSVVGGGVTGAWFVLCALAAAVATLRRRARFDRRQ
jgi:hypothetical protein